MKATIANLLVPSSIILLIGSTAVLSAADSNPLLVPATLTASLLNSDSSANSVPDHQGRFSLGTDAGVAMHQDLTLSGIGDGHMTFDLGFRFDVAARYQLTEYWSCEFQTGVVYNSIDKIAGVSLSSVGLSADFTQIPLLADLIYTIPIHGPLSAYFGAGMGGVVSLFHGEGNGSTTDHTDFTFGFQGIAGMKYAINDRMDLGLVYKFLGTSDHDFGSGLTSNGSKIHSVMVAFSYKF